MNKKEYSYTFKETLPDEFKKSFEQIDQMTDEQKKELIKKINTHYEKELTGNLTFWISMMDYCNHIKYLDNLDTQKSVFVTSNNEFIKFIKLLKKRQNNLLVIKPEDFYKTINEKIK